MKIAAKRKPSKWKKVLLAIAAVLLILAAAVYFYLFPYIDYNTGISWDRVEAEEPKTAELHYPVFDGERVWEQATVVMENGRISSKSVFGEGETDSDYFLMPGLIDAHVHINKTKQMKLMVSKGVTAACDASISRETKESFDLLKVWTACTSAWPGEKDGRAFVEKMISQGAQYIKIVADLPQIMGGGTMDAAVFQDMIDCAHEHGLKAAVHAISIEGVRMAVDAGADMLIHIPIGETFPRELAEQIAKQGIEVMPTMVMMKAFADSPLYGYEEEDYQDAIDAVKLLRSMDVTILAATDSNRVGFVPCVVHGSSLHEEMRLLVEAGMTPLEVLQAATENTAKAFGLEDAGVIAPGQPATMVLVKGRPDQDIADSADIVQIWVDGKPLLEQEEK